MKKIFLMLLCSFLLLGITGCGEKKDSNNLIKELAIEEGCYYTEKSKDHFRCFVEGPEYYDVLHKDGEYYNDPYYNNSVPTEKTNRSISLEYENEIITLNYHLSDTSFGAYVCSSTNSKTLQCTETSSLAGQITTTEFTYTKVDKVFTKDIITNLPIYERNKPFEIIFENKTLSCNLTWGYSIINMGATSPIKNCLDSKLGEEYTIAQVSKDERWQIYPKSIAKKDSNYLIDNYSYNVTVNDKTFGFMEAFPIDPYATDEEMVVKIVKVGTKESNTTSQTKTDENDKYIGTYKNNDGHTLTIKKNANGKLTIANKTMTMNKKNKDGSFRVSSKKETTAQGPHTTAYDLYPVGVNLVYGGMLTPEKASDKKKIRILSFDSYASETNQNDIYYKVS